MDAATAAAESDDDDDDDDDDGKSDSGARTLSVPHTTTGPWLTNTAAPFSLMKIDASAAVGSAAPPAKCFKAG